MKKFYITTTLPYVNAEPHIGFAAEIIKADVIARWRGLLGDEVFFNTGTDEHGLKIYRKAVEQGKPPQEYCDEYAAKFDNLKHALNLSYNNFIRTTDEQHIAAAQEFWRRCADNGDIYKKTYKVKYCVGCEMEKTDSELINGECPLHPGQNLEEIEEENYFFRWSKYQDALLNLYDSRPDFVLPEFRLKEIRNFVAAGLQDFSISRLKEKMPWGVPVPGDENQVMYVWFDALVNYISCLGWPDDEKKFAKFWPGLQVCGKDNLRQQTAMWQAMLMSANIANSKQVLVFGFITSGGQKMSKSLGNVVNPFEVVEKYGTDALRYYLLGEVQTFDDGDYSEEKFLAKYNADLANGIGNLTSRILTLAEKIGVEHFAKLSYTAELDLQACWNELAASINKYQLDVALKKIMELVRWADGYLAENKPWGKAVEPASAQSVIVNCLIVLQQIAMMLQPFIPQTAEEILRRLGVEQIDWRSGRKPEKKFGKRSLHKGDPLFARK